MNFARVMFSGTILLTFPIECFVTREVNSPIRARFRIFPFATYRSSRYAFRVVRAAENKFRALITASSGDHDGDQGHGRAGGTRGLYT